MDPKMFEHRFSGARGARSCLFALSATAVGLGACGSRSPLSVDPRAGDDVIIDSGIADEPDAFVPVCFKDSRLIGEIPIDLYFTMDRSLSMSIIDPGSRVSRWDAVSAAMNVLLQSPMSAGLGAGIGFFPRTGAGGQPLCTSADYFYPVVPIGTLGGTTVVSANIAAAIGAQTLASGTPTTPALDGAHKYARSEQVAHGDRIAAVVLVTDGVPRQCASTVPTAAAIATEALSGSPPIKTYVLGVGPSLSNLNAIAQAGGTDEAFLVESGGPDALTAALETIRTSALTCEYAIPPGDRATLAAASVWTRTGADGMPILIHEVANALACGSGPGWFYDHPSSGDGASTPSKIILCPASCDPVTHADNSHLDVALGCGAADGS
jgi:hypothetical protein